MLTFANLRLTFVSSSNNNIFPQHAGDLALPRGHAAADQADQLRRHGGRQVRPVGLCGGQVGGSTKIFLSVKIFL